MAFAKLKDWNANFDALGFPDLAVKGFGDNFLLFAVVLLLASRGYGCRRLSSDKVERSVVLGAVEQSL